MRQNSTLMIHGIWVLEVLLPLLVVVVLSVHLPVQRCRPVGVVVSACRWRCFGPPCQGRRRRHVPWRGRRRLVRSVTPAGTSFRVCPQARVVIVDVSPDIRVGLTRVVRTVVTFQVKLRVSHLQGRITWLTQEHFVTHKSQNTSHQIFQTTVLSRMT